MRMNNEVALREITSAKNQNLEEKIKEMQEELLININKQDEMNTHIILMEQELNDLKTEKGLRSLDEQELSLE